MEADEPRDPSRTPLTRVSEDSAARSVPGADAAHPFAFPFAAWRSICARLWTMNAFHALPLLAAGMAFYSFLALAPALAAVILLYGLVGDPAMVNTNVAQFTNILPGEATELVRRQMLSITQANRQVTGIGFAAALLFAVIGVMRAATATIKALDTVNEEHESRSIPRFYVLAVKLTLGGILLALVGVAAGATFAWLRFQAAEMLGPGGRLTAQVATWLAAAAIASFGFATIFRYAPDRRPARWRWLVPGALLATALWIAATLGFGVYVSNFANYNATYGALGAVVVLLMWLWLSSYAVLLGAQANAEMERQTFTDSTVGPPRPMGDRGAVLADSRALDEVSIMLLEKRRRREADSEARRVTRKALGLGEG